MRIGRIRLASAWAAGVGVLGLWMSPVRAQEPAAAAAAPEFTVEIRPEKSEWLEAETIRGVVVFTNTGATDVLMPPPDAAPLVTLRRGDGGPLETLLPTGTIIGQPGFFRPDPLAPGSFRTRWFFINTEPLEPRFGRHFVAPPDEYELAFAGLDGLEGVRIAPTPTRITVIRGKVAVGERIIHWASDGWLFAAQRESGVAETVELVTGTRLRTEISAAPRRSHASGLDAMRERFGLPWSGHRAPWVTTTWQVVFDPPCIDLGLWEASVAAPRWRVEFRDGATGKASPVRPLGRRDDGAVAWFVDRSEQDGGVIDELVRLDCATGSISRRPFNGGYPWAVSPGGDYLVGGDSRSAGHRHAPKIVAAALLEGDVVGEWRTLFESAHIDPPEGVSGEDVHHFAWLAGVHGVYRALVGGGMRFVSYDGESSFEFGSDLWFPIEESEDGRYVALASSFGRRTELAKEAPMTVEVWDVAERRRVLRIEEPDMFDVRIAGLAELLVKVDVMGDYDTRWYGDEVEVYSLVRGELEFTRTIGAGIGD